MAHLIVVGNEKGGAGKSTTAMHIATALARMGHATGVIDLDLRQRSLARYLENRRATIAREGLSLAMPEVAELPKIGADQVAAGEHAIDRRFAEAIDGLDGRCAFTVIDCPGAHSRISQMAHALADTLVTPLNDSFVDFDMLARMDPDGEEILGPSVYSEMVWAARQSRASAGMKPLDWVVMRNRIGAQHMINKAKIESAVERLAKRIGFRVGPGFGERVIFRELFPRGLTLLDLRDAGVRGLSLSGIAARAELRETLKALKLPGVKVDF
ncbi:division plane positioning ATPase MipZ [Pseudoroseicyclus sp. CXY001]|uniref:division plane positioning ATPase MipZ n=1 Tax=Pseudoroseicyclus sp. CXY001 TaxID=3242492 RepID=UPI0035712E9F